MKFLVNLDAEGRIEKIHGSPAHEGCNVDDAGNAREMHLADVLMLFDSRERPENPVPVAGNPYEHYCCVRCFGSWYG